MKDQFYDDLLEVSCCKEEKILFLLGKCYTGWNYI